MVKKGRFYINLDVHWYSEWGCEVSAHAALLWVLALGKAKQLKSATLTHAQIRSIAPVDLSTSEFESALEELLTCEAAPIGGDRGAMGAIALYGFMDWNGGTEASKNGQLGNHIRWHVNTGKPDDTCGYCKERDESIAPIGGRPISDRYTESESDTKDLCPSDLEMEFDQCWVIYPRKESKGKSKECFIARRRKGTSLDDLMIATKNYAEKIKREGTEKNFMMLGSTFYGSHNRWEDFMVVPVVESKDKDRVALGAGPMFTSEAEREAFYGTTPIELEIP